MFVLTYQNPDEQDATAVVAVSVNPDRLCVEGAAYHELHTCDPAIELVWRARRGGGFVGRLREDGNTLVDFYEIAPVLVVE